MRQKQRSYTWEGSNDPQEHRSHWPKGLFLQAR
jgi:hypothetical protein